MEDKTGPVATDAPRLSLSELFTRLIAEAEAFIRAEVRLYRAQATRKAFSAGLIVAMIAGAFMLVQTLLITVAIGVVLTIAPAVGMGWAVLIVASVTIVLIAFCIVMGRARLSALLKPEDAP